MSRGGRRGGGGWRSAALLVLVCARAAVAADDGDAFWVERWSPAAGHRWLGVDENRRVEVVDLAPGSDVVVGVLEGTLSEIDARALAAAARRALKVPEPRAGGPIPEGDILRIGGRLDGARVARSWRPDRQGMAGARVLAAIAERFANELVPVPGRHARIRATPVDPKRAAQLKKDGRLPFPRRVEAERIPAVARALADPGWLVSATPDDAVAFRALAGGGRQLFVSDDATFDLEILSSEEEPR